MKHKYKITVKNNTHINNYSIYDAQMPVWAGDKWESIKIQFYSGATPPITQSLYAIVTYCQEHTLVNVIIDFKIQVIHPETDKVIETYDISAMVDKVDFGNDKLYDINTQITTRYPSLTLTPIEVKYIIEK